MTTRPDETATEQAFERLHALESALDALRQEADESSRLATLGLLSATVAHELRNVLTPVLSFAQLAQAQPDNPELAAKSIERTIEGIRTAAQILDSTLDFATATSPQKDRSGSGIEDVLARSLACLARDPARDGIDIQIDIAPDLEAAIKPLALQQVFMNLLLNAIKAMKHARGCARRSPANRVRITGWQPTPDTVRLELADTGPGILPDIAERLFEPFVTAPATPEGSGGTGLGLAICRRLVEEAHGSIRVESEPGRGATFLIDLPAATNRSLRKAG